MAQVITTKFVGPTNTKGSRVSVKSWVKNKVVAWDHALNSEENHSFAVAKLLQELNKQRKEDGCTLGWKIIGGGNMPDGSGYGFVVELVKGDSK